MLWRASLSDNPQSFIERARECLQNRVRFPNTLDEVQMLQTLEQSAFARYLLGCFWYSKRRYAEAVSCWQFTLVQEADFAPAHRLLGIYAWNKLHDAQQAKQYLSQAVALEPQNARFLFELDYLNKLMAQPAEQRLQRLEASKEIVFQRDDLTVELLSLWNGLGRYDDAAAVLRERVFHPWEGGEGKATGQYLLNQLHRALAAVQSGDPQTAITQLQQALHYPKNLGEGRLRGKRITTSGICWGIARSCKAISKNLSATSPVRRAAEAHWMPDVTTTTSQWTISSGRVWRRENLAMMQRRTLCSIASCNGLSRITTTCRMLISLPYRYPTWWCWIPQ